MSTHSGKTEARKKGTYSSNICFQIKLDKYLLACNIFEHEERESSFNDDDNGIKAEMAAFPPPSQKKVEKGKKSDHKSKQESDNCRLFPSCIVRQPKNKTYI